MAYRSLNLIILRRCRKSLIFMIVLRLALQWILLLSSHLIKVAVSQLEYSRAIGSLMYVMISTRPHIAYAFGKLSRYTSNLGASHWQAMNQVFRYLKGTMKYGLTCTRFPSVLKGYADASWINNKEDHSSTSGWTFLLGGGAISWASKKHTCITDSTMESKFVD
ncbi:secreted RxLR effector protein 161-like [Helianthus annuus]|uniref:secreted RxLR effector protein 161-like n=1 Tax=Helianthus annuus TaxID=4232 RepID=UPI0016531DAB|nr:secreted RxLR effector protein 161-like [Helianthus annuus]